MMKRHRKNTNNDEEKSGVTMNRKDLLMLAHLRNDGRMQLTEMSRKTGIPVSTLFDRMKSSDGFVKRHTCLLDFDKLGFHTRVNITLKVNKADRQAVKDYLSKHPAVNMLYKINNDFDFMIEGIFRQVTDVEEFCEALEERFRIDDKKIFFVVEDVKREGFLSDPALVQP
jgi:DNA-binding Lrp family transcriptional regulator